METEGMIVSGLGKGKKFLQLEDYLKQIKEKIGFVPFPGTLNIKIGITDRQKLETKKSIIISGFQKYGSILAYRCAINKQQCAIIIPEKTGHVKDILEIIAPINLREKFNLKDGGRIKITLE